MIPRRRLLVLKEAIARQAAVALIGPRQVAKATLAMALVDEIPSLYLDLEATEHRRQLADPALFLREYEHQLVVLDEIHRVPELFSTLRGLIDQGRRRGHRTGRFLLLGSASMDPAASVGRKPRRPDCPCGSGAARRPRTEDIHQGRDAALVAWRLPG